MFEAYYTRSPLTLASSSLKTLACCSPRTSSALSSSASRSAWRRECQGGGLKARLVGRGRKTSSSMWALEAARCKLSSKRQRNEKQGFDDLLKRKKCLLKRDKRQEVATSPHCYLTLLSSATSSASRSTVPLSAPTTYFTVPSRTVLKKVYSLPRIFHSKADAHVQKTYLQNKIK